MKFYQENPQAMQELQAPLFEEKIVDYILELASVTERTVKIDELLADPAVEESGNGKTKKASKKKSGKVKSKAKAKAKSKSKGK